MKDLMTGEWGNAVTVALMLMMICDVQAAPNMRLHGALVAEPCVIPPGEEEIRLDFGSIVDKYLYANSRTLGQAFDINLTECDLTLGNSVNVTFIGMESVALPGLLALDSGSEATGVAIGIETQAMQPVLVNQTSEKFPLQAGGNRIELQAYVRGEPAALSNHAIGYGAFTATATFSLEYE
jgi:type 1 fimbria pilin